MEHRMIKNKRLPFCWWISNFSIWCIDLWQILYVIPGGNLRITGITDLAISTIKFPLIFGYDLMECFSLFNVLVYQLSESFLT